MFQVFLCLKACLLFRSNFFHNFIFKEKRKKIKHTFQVFTQVFLLLKFFLLFRSNFLHDFIILSLKKKKKKKTTFQDFIPKSQSIIQKQISPQFLNFIFKDNFTQYHFCFCKFTYIASAYRIIKYAMKGTTKDNIKFLMVGYLQKMVFNNYLID